MIPFRDKTQLFNFKTDNKQFAKLNSYIKTIFILKRYTIKIY